LGVGFLVVFGSIAVASDPDAVTDAAPALKRYSFALSMAGCFAIDATAMLIFRG
jgi:hypothetical protein